MPDAQIIPFPNVMTPEQYDAERARIAETYGESNAEAIAKRDQAMAALFAKSGWTQEQLAQREGKSQDWVALRLRFGRFLNFTTTGRNDAGLTERRFRGFWNQTKGEEETRFQEVARVMQEEPAAKPAPIWPTMRKDFGDGKWHAVQEVADKLDVPVAQIEKNIRENGNRHPNGRLETKQVGSKRRGDIHTQFRVFPKARDVSPTELRAKLMPLVAKLKEQGRLSEAAIVPGIVLNLASQIENLIDEWTR